LDNSIPGQLYPSILIATLVGMALQARSAEGRKPDPICGYWECPTPLQDFLLT
jgi:hypothetical protein